MSTSTGADSVLGHVGQQLTKTLVSLSHINQLTFEICYLPHTRKIAQHGKQVLNFSKTCMGQAPGLKEWMLKVVQHKFYYRFIHNVAVIASYEAF